MTKKSSMYYAGTMRTMFIAFALLLSSCCHNSNQAWEDVKTAGRYMQRGMDQLWGNDSDSRMFSSDTEFVGPYEEGFIPLNDADLRTVADAAIPQPMGIPGEKGVPLLSHYQSGDEFGFSSVHFETDEHVLRERADILMIERIVAYLKKNPKAYFMVEGHCDERAPAGYNMALGMRRANHIRALLVKNGIDRNRIYPVSHGKERPLSLGHTPEDWKLNRRAEFRIFNQRNS